MSDGKLVMIAGDVRVSTPASLEAMTRYVLLEQEDWFEDETTFVRRLLRSGMRVIDIGANYGVYALTAARLVGPTGRVWAFEPSSLPHRHLQDSRAVNGFDSLTLIKAALSDQPGRARITVNPNPELNALLDGTSGAGQPSEEVDVTTLDECAQRFDFGDISFVKMDAEGHEPRILTGGIRFFAESSPLVMFEIKAGATFNLDLIASLAAIGYDAYRLIPGIGQLVPFHVGRIDPFQLNAFACKPDRARRLCEQGFLVTADPNGTETIDDPDPDAWWTHLARYPYAARLGDNWHRQTPARPEWETYRAALGSYARARSDGPPAQRYAHLCRSFAQLRQLLERAPGLPRLLSFAQVAADLGQRALAVQALAVLVNHIQTEGPFDVGEPFIVGDVYAALEPGDDLGRWVASAIAAQHEKLWAFSSYFTGNSGLDNLEGLRRAGIQTPEMERRRQLVRLRFGLQDRPQPSPLLQARSADNLNPEFWSGENY